MLQIIKTLAPLNRVFCSSDYDRAIEYLKKILLFEVLEYSGEYNGWIIPPRWDILEAKIIKDGKVIYDGLLNPLRVIALSKSFRGEIELEELKKHLHYDRRNDEYIPFHFRQLYRSWERDWGFCVPKLFYDSLKDGKYFVSIRTNEAIGKLKILDYTHRGKNKETFVFVAHLDHPGMANDDLSGCAVGIELFRRLSKKTRYTYKLLLVPEIIGSEFWRQNDSQNDIVEGLFLEMLGSKTQLAVQKSENSQYVEPALLKSLTNVPYRYGASIIRNDEYVWEARGVPMPSFSRYPYPEYHSNFDNSQIISGRSLSEAVKVLEKTVRELEKNFFISRNFRGVICLSNPKYQLYMDRSQPAFGEKEDARWQKLTDLIFSSKILELRTLSRKTGLTEKAILSYLKRWEEKGLLKIAS